MDRAKGHFRRTLVLAIALGLPGSALALGLGEARVDSYLNQPLDVRMRLLDASADALDTLTVKLAAPAEFERLGLMSNVLALDLEVTVDRTQEPPVIRVRSTRAVSDPVVQLLIDARWSGGRMLREYTLFLDPPTLPVAPPRASTSAASSAAAPEPQADRPAAPMMRQSPEVLRPATQRPAGAEPARPRAVSGRSYGPVGAGETLWSIARAALPADDITMDQMMIAIVELNPGAFRDRNVNLLLRGAQLKLPTAEQARALDPAFAAAAVAEDNRAFRAGRRQEVPVVSDAGRMLAYDMPAEAAPSRPAAASTAAVDHRLELVPPNEDGDGAAASGVDPEAEVASLRQQLARTEEELLAARQEAREFRNRLRELEALVRERQAGVGLRDAELAGLEQTLREARMASEEGADPALRAEVSERLDQYLADLGQPGADAESMPDDDAIGDLDAGLPAAQVTAPMTAPSAAVDEPQDRAEEPEPEPAAAPPVVTQVGRERSLLDRIFGAPMWLLGGLIALVVAVLAFLALLSKRSRGKTEAAPARRAAVAPAARPATKSSAADPLAEARAAVRARPHDLAAHLALLRALSADELKFGEALESMFEHVESGREPEWREALELAERIVPGHALVKGSADWIADAREPDPKPASELERDAEVDDLMLRLDADMEDDDGTALDDGARTEAPVDRDAAIGPLLRDDHESESKPGTGSSLADDDTVDFSDWLRDADETAPTETSRAEPASDDLVLEWPDLEPASGKREEPAAPTLKEAAEPSPGLESKSAMADDDTGADEVFAPGDDDVEVKLDLARAYVSWNSIDSARTLLQEILREGNQAQRDEARKLLDELGDGRH